MRENWGSWHSPETVRPPPQAPIIPDGEWDTSPSPSTTRAHVCPGQGWGEGGEEMVSTGLPADFHELYIQQIGSLPSVSSSRASTSAGGRNRERNLVVCTYHPRSAGKTQTGGNTKDNSQVSPKNKLQGKYIGAEEGKLWIRGSQTLMCIRITQSPG